MRLGGRFPDDQAEIVFSDAFVEQLEALTADQREQVLTSVVALCADPGGKHPLGARHGRRALVGCNTVAVLGGTQRVVYQVDEPGASIVVLCMGHRRGSEVYDIATALAATLLTEAEAAQMWAALAVLDVLPESVGMDGWDYRPPPAPEGMRKTAVASGLLPADIADLLSADELAAAMAHGWGPDGADADLALAAAVRRARGNAGFDSARLVVTRRAEPRCDAWMPRAKTLCIRRVGHPGPHRATP